jgi:hypothetical protein
VPDERTAKGLGTVSPLKHSGMHRKVILPDDLVVFTAEHNKVLRYYEDSADAHLFSKGSLGNYLIDHTQG